jgi:heptosyltransferase-2
MNLTEVKFDCKFFRGDIPCSPNKLLGKVCITCDEYQPIKTRILIIKLGALGDVIRSTPLITRFRKIYPDAHITWVTRSPDILPKQMIDKICTFDFKSIYSITHQQYDIAVNLDKETEACSLLADVVAKKKYGFIWKDNRIDAASPAAEHKLITGFFDNISKVNTKNYPEEIFEMCDLKFEGEEYLLNFNVDLSKKWNSIRQDAAGKKIIGLNTGCGKRWLTRLWPSEYWVELITLLKKENYYPVLLGGADEDAMNKKYSSLTGAYYPGTYSLEEFIALTSNCDVVLTAVSMMMHIATALKIPMALFVNIFNPHEFHLYGRGVILQPTTGCDDYYGNTCTRERCCMNDISVETVFNAIKELAAK